ncbi:MAG TPA: hypothetical protein VGQ32_01400 [Thermoanaerobaculia bacterium]|jgi:hypothetical protein|nr:hypothetical protein [Thermoanaerobaculia bacterium]
MADPVRDPVERRQYDRRTGVAFLSLVAATSVLPWMELLMGETASFEPLAQSEIRVAVGTCLLALILLLGAWFSGRYRSIPESPRIERPRRAGLQLSIAAAAANLILAGAIRYLEGSSLFGMPASLAIFTGAWYLVVLPLELAAGVALGRAGRMPGRRKERAPL